MKDTLVVGFVYPGVEPYMADYLKSIWSQTYSDFDLFLGDGRDYVKARQEVVSHAWECYEYIVWTDCDDWFSDNRVELSRKALEDGADFVYNELNVNGKNVLANSSPRYGLSNTAVQANILRGIKIPRGTVEIDRFIYESLMANGYSGKFIGDAVTYYRQYETNTIWRNK